MHSAKIMSYFESRVARGEGCWLWCGILDRYGYGRFKADHITYKAHRVAHELFVGAIPAGLDCKHGHEYTPENTYIRPSGCRDCRACIRERQRRCQARRHGREQWPRIKARA